MMYDNILCQDLKFTTHDIHGMCVSNDIIIKTINAEINIKATGFYLTLLWPPEK
jgi:hypothetical protein